MVGAGVAHLAIPNVYLRVMPPYLPYPAALVLLSGLAEIAGGVGLMIPSLRRSAAYGLIALFVAVFPANINMALHPLPGIPIALLWLRLPLQLPLIYWAYCVGLRHPKDG
jgi:uncharacterized membrane protein